MADSITTLFSDIVPTAAQRQQQELSRGMLLAENLQTPGFAAALNQPTRSRAIRQAAGGLLGLDTRTPIEREREENQALFQRASTEAQQRFPNDRTAQLNYLADQLQNAGKLVEAQKARALAQESQLQGAKIGAEQALMQKRRAETQETLNQPPATETIIEGDEKVTYQWDPVNQRRVEIARGPRYKPGTEVNINQGEGAFDKQLGQDMSQQYTESVSAIQNASKSLENLSVMEGLLDQGVITGSLANSRTAVEKALATAGLIDGQRVTNTETFLATGAQQTLALLQTGAAGAGTGISDADRDFMEKAAGGNITVTEEAIRRIIRINRQIARNVYGTHNKIVNDIKNTFPNSEASKRLTERYYVGQRAKKADGTIIVFDGQGWVEEQ